MQVKLYILSTLLLFSTLTFQTNKTDLLCSKKWKMISMKSGQLERKVPPKKNAWMKFYKDGKHEAHADGVIENGTWSFTENKDSIIFIDSKKRKRTMSLDSLSTHQFHITYREGNRNVTFILKN